MGKDQNEKWVNYMTDSMVGRHLLDAGIVYEVTIKIKTNDVFVIIRAGGEEGPKVCFAGGGTLKSVIEKVRVILHGEGGKWRHDRYAKLD